MKNKKIDLQKSLNLLIVDQDEITLLVQRKTAESTGLFRSIRSATNGLRAYDLIVLGSDGIIPFPDVILFDPDLPLLNGIILLKVLQKSDIRGKEKIVFIVSASCLSDGEKEVARSLGVSAFLPKPLSGEDLESVLRSIYALKRESVEG